MKNTPLSFIYTHIPKCGGASFRKLIFETSRKCGIPEKSIWIPGCGSVHYSSNLAQLNEEELILLRDEQLLVLADHTKYQGHLQYNLKLESPFYFTILRDPLERFFSHYNFFYKTHGEQDCKGISLEDLPDEKLETITRQISNIQVKYLSNFKDGGKLSIKEALKIATYNLLFEFGSFGILESIDQSLKLLNRKCPKWIQFESQIGLHNQNPQENNHSEKLIKFVERHNQEDIQLYQIAKSAFKERLKMI